VCIFKFTQYIFKQHYLKQSVDNWSPYLVFSYLSNAHLS